MGAGHTHKVKMEKLGQYSEQVSIFTSGKEIVEILTSPLLRVTGNEEGMDFRLTVEDKKAVLWFLETKVPEGKAAVLSVRKRLGNLESK